MGTALYQAEGRDDVRRRLVSSICRYQGKPVYVRTNVGPNIEIQSMDGVGTRSVVPHTHPDFDYRSPPLGYMNLEKQAWYLTRQPDRNNARAGLSQDMLVCSNGEYAPGFATKEMGDCILANHPTYQEAIKNVLENDWESCAFHRHFSIVRAGLGLGVHYRGRLVGLLELGRLRLIQSGESSFLEHILRKSGVMID